MSRSLERANESGPHGHISCRWAVEMSGLVSRKGAAPLWPSLRVHSGPIYQLEPAANDSAWPSSALLL